MTVSDARAVMFHHGPFAGFPAGALLAMESGRRELRRQARYGAGIVKRAATVLLATETRPTIQRHCYACDGIRTWRCTAPNTIACDACGSTVERFGPKAWEVARG